jgi:O-antigen/teichoic acid export membrane protein
MSATTSGMITGIILGLVFVLLAQEFGFLSLSGLDAAVEYLVIGAVIGGVVFAVIGWLLGRRYLAKHPPPTDSPATP